jgi:hypothetical protein
VNLSFDETELQELQDIRERYVYERIAEAPKEEEPKEEEPKEEEVSYEEIKQQLDTLWSNDSYTTRKDILFAVRDYIANNKLSIEKYTLLRDYAACATKKMIKRYIYDTELLNWCSDFMEFLQCHQSEFSPFIVKCVTHYDLFNKLANHYHCTKKEQINLLYTHYVEWKEEGNGAYLNRWKSMKYWWDNVRN